MYLTQQSIFVFVPNRIYIDRERESERPRESEKGERSDIVTFIMTSSVYTLLSSREKK